jgi:uncharacterized membrane protein YkoI
MLAAMTAITLAAMPAAAQVAKKATVARHETMAQLRAAAKVPEKTARASAQAQVPKGTIRKHELERENGKLVYTYDIATKGKAGIDEVQIDAITGAVVSTTHETPAMEKVEVKTARKEARTVKPAAKKS